jgi:hypothetical protein
VKLVLVVSILFDDDVELLLADGDFENNFVETCSECQLLKQDLPVIWQQSTCAQRFQLVSITLSIASWAFFTLRWGLECCHLLNAVPAHCPALAIALLLSLA